jgi:uncharacterized protein YecT (DUF1311 family)
MMSQRRTTKAITAAAIVFATFASSLPARAQDHVSPSFDCAKESGAVEQAICGDDKLAELDQYIAQYFKVALADLNAADAAALRADQRAWLATRAAKLAEGVDELKTAMEDRAHILVGTLLNANPLLGVWANSASSIMIRDRRGLIIEPQDQRCNLNEAQYVGDTIVVHTGPDGKGAENFSLRISRRGPLLKIEEVPPTRRGKAPPQHACTEGGVIAGIYFQKSRYLKRY